MSDAEILAKYGVSDNEDDQIIAKYTQKTPVFTPKTPLEAMLSARYDVPAADPKTLLDGTIRVMDYIPGYVRGALAGAGRLAPGGQAPGLTKEELKKIALGQGKTWSEYLRDSGIELGGASLPVDLALDIVTANPAKLLASGAKIGLKAKKLPELLNRLNPANAMPVISTGIDKLAQKTQRLPFQKLASKLVRSKGKVSRREFYDWLWNNGNFRFKGLGNPEDLITEFKRLEQEAYAPVASALKEAGNTAFSVSEAVPEYIRMYRLSKLKDSGLSKEKLKFAWRKIQKEDPIMWAKKTLGDPHTNKKELGKIVDLIKQASDTEFHPSINAIKENLVTSSVNTESAVKAIRNYLDDVSFGPRTAGELKIAKQTYSRPIKEGTKFTPANVMDTALSQGFAEKESKALTKTLGDKATKIKKDRRKYAMLTQLYDPFAKQMETLAGQQGMSKLDTFLTAGLLTGAATGGASTNSGVGAIGGGGVGYASAKLLQELYRRPGFSGKIAGALKTLADSKVADTALQRLMINLGREKQGEQEQNPWLNLK